MSTTALPTSTQRKIKVNLTESKQQDNVDDQQHHISVGLIIDEDTNNNCDESIQPTISEGIETQPIKEQPTRNNIILDDDDEQCEPTNILTIVDEEVEKTSLDNQAENQEEDKTPIVETKIYEKPVKTPRFEELIIEEEEPVKRENVDRVKKPSSSSPENNRKSGDELLENDKSNDSEFSLMSVPSKVLNFFEKMIISNKGRIEMMKSLGNLMYFGSKTRTDVDVENEISDKMSLLNDIYETEKISTVISVIGWYQDYVSDKHKLQNKKIQSDSRFSPYHRAGQYLRLLECFILLVEIIFKKRSTYGENGKKNYWNLLIMTEVVKALIKLLATSKSKTNAPLFLNYNILPPDEQASNIPMASFLPVIPKYSPFDKEASSMDKFANNYKNQAKPKFGSRSGRQIPSSDQLMAILKSGNDDVPTTSQLGEQLGLNIDSDKFMLLAPQTEELKGSLGKILMYISDTLYSLRPVVYAYLLSKHGFKSWIPFVVSLLVELASIYLTRRAIRIVKKDIKEKSPSVPPEVGSTIEEELNRRTSSLSHYLYRGPLFEILMERILKSILLPIFKRIPLIGASFVGYIEYIIMIQQFYFFCNPSV